MWLRIGRWLVVGGGLVVLLGLILGFWGLFTGMGQGALGFFMLATLGFTLAFTGLTVVVLLEPRDDPGGPD